MLRVRGHFADEVSQVWYGEVLEDGAREVKELGARLGGDPDADVLSLAAVGFLLCPVGQAQP